MKSLPRSIARLLASGLVAFGLFVSGGPALAADYTITDLGNLGGSSYATGINASGQVVGYSSTPYETEHAFLYSSGTMQDLGTLGGSNSQAYGINASGQVVGGSGIAGNSYCYDAFLSMRDLGLGGSFSQANGINDSGQVVGTFTNEWDEQHAFLYNNGTMQDLGTIGGASSSAYGINASGQVVGASTWTSLSDYGHAFLYSNGKMQDLGTLGGIYGSSAYGINASGQVVGYCISPAPATISLATSSTPFSTATARCRTWAPWEEATARQTASTTRARWWANRTPPTTVPSTPFFTAMGP